MKRQTEFFHLTEPWLMYQTFVFSAPYKSEMHRHPAWQLTATLDGSTFFQTKEERILTLPGEWILISPEMMHGSGSESEKSTAIQIFFRRFPADLFPEFAERFNYRRDIFLKGQTDRKTLERIARDFSEKGAETNPLFRSSRTLLGLEFVFAALSNAPAENGKRIKRNPVVEHVMEYMEEHFAEPLGIADFAEKAGLSESRFGAVFREVTGCSPMKIFNEIRMAHAQTFLLDGNNVRETALLCGFSSAPYFCRCFRQSFGVSPGEFQKDPLGKM